MKLFFDKLPFDQVFEFLEEADPLVPIPIPCLKKGCDGAWMTYDTDTEMYVCPICGKTVKKMNISKYLKGKK